MHVRYRRALTTHLVSYEAHRMFKPFSEMPLWGYFREVLLFAAVLWLVLKLIRPHIDARFGRADEDKTT